MLEFKDWAEDLLRTIAQSIYDLKAAAGWDTADYISTMTHNGDYKLPMNRKSAYFWDAGVPADVEVKGKTIHMNVYDILTTESKDLQLFNLVHEQVHVWDAASGGALSGNMMKATGSEYVCPGIYIAPGATSSPYVTTHKEDWADTVAAAVYPGKGRSIDASW